MVSALNAGGEGPNSAVVFAKPPLPPVPDPQIGYVDFPATSSPNAYTSVFHPASSLVLNNDAFIVIVGTAGSQTYYTYGITINNAPTNGIDDPTSASGSAPVGYQDGKLPSEVAGYAVAPTLPDLTIRAIGAKNQMAVQTVPLFKPESSLSPPIPVASLVAMPRNSPSVTSQPMPIFITPLTVPTHPAPTRTQFTWAHSPRPPTSGRWASLSIQTNTLFKVRAFRENFQPSGIVSIPFATSTNFPANYHQLRFGQRRGFQRLCRFSGTDVLCASHSGPAARQKNVQSAVQCYRD